MFGMRHFWRQKHTTGFKTCWALMWPTLGGGIMLAVQPDPDRAAQSLLDAKQLRERREANEAIRRLATGGGGGGGQGPR